MSRFTLAGAFLRRSTSIPALRIGDEPAVSQSLGQPLRLEACVDQRARGADYVEDRDDIALIECVHFKPAATELGGDAGLQVGEGEIFCDLGRGEGAAAGLLAARSGRAYNVSVARLLREPACARQLVKEAETELPSPQLIARTFRVRVVSKLGPAGRSNISERPDSCNPRAARS